MMLLLLMMMMMLMMIMVVQRVGECHDGEFVGEDILWKFLSQTLSPKP